MSDIMEKARLGRVAALASLNGKPGAMASSVGIGARYRAGASHEKVIFFSTRARRNDGAFIA
jgi:hypothetical protein